MKKFISILLLVLYSSTAFSVAVDIHFCAGKFSGIAIPGIGINPHCGCDHSSQTHKNCCTDKIVFSKADNHKTVQPVAITQNWTTVVLPELQVWLLEKYNAPEISNTNNFSSGFIRSHSGFYRAFLCIFRI
ncbi:MAG: hypothetical protein JST34_07775 [Bacteroidetes bacterium]|nr:hypothetical protein [Bacteroidota bacterium]